MASKLPYDYEGNVDFYEYWERANFEEYEDGYYVDYPDKDDNGYADFYDDWKAGKDEPDIVLRPSQNHAGG